MLTTEPRSETAQPTGSTALIAEIAALRAQRDELLAALRDVQRIHEQPTHNGCVDGVSPGTLAHNVARAAIAKAEGRS